VPTQHVECIWDPEVARVLGRASLAYLAVETSRGPHVTPLLFAATPDRLWFGIGRGTLKARAVAKRPAVGVVVPGENASVAIRGEATLVDRLSAPPPSWFGRRWHSRPSRPATHSRWRRSPATSRGGGRAHSRSPW